MKLIYRIKPPCPKCPYKLEQVMFFIDPCPQFKDGGYRIYEIFKDLFNRERNGKSMKGGEAGCKN